MPLLKESIWVESGVVKKQGGGNPKFASMIEDAFAPSETFGPTGEESKTFEMHLLKIQRLGFSSISVSYCFPELLQSPGGQLGWSASYRIHRTEWMHWEPS